MRSSYDIELSESCSNCKFRGDGFFCQLSPSELNDLDRVAWVSVHPSRAMLFMEQQRARGIFFVCEGKVKLSFTSNEGKSLVLRIAKPGEVLGLLSALLANPYELTAETLGPCQVAFVSSHDFQLFLRKHPAIFERVASQLGRQYKAACDQLRVIGLSASIFERVAKFLLNWSADEGAPGNGSQFSLPLNHEEMAEHMGITRESVSRALSEFRSQGLIESCDSTFVIADRVALQALSTRPVTSQEESSHASPHSRLTGPRPWNRHSSENRSRMDGK